jgi:hypothetical protein
VPANRGRFAGGGRWLTSRGAARAQVRCAGTSATGTTPAASAIAASTASSVSRLVRTRPSIHRNPPGGTSPSEGSDSSATRSAGALYKDGRNAMLGDQMRVWSALFDVKGVPLPGGHAGVGAPALGLSPTPEERSWRTPRARPTGPHDLPRSHGGSAAPPAMTEGRRAGRADGCSGRGGRCDVGLVDGPTRRAELA